MGRGRGRTKEREEGGQREGETHSLKTLLQDCYFFQMPLSSPWETVGIQLPPFPTYPGAVRRRREG